MLLIHVLIRVFRVFRCSIITYFSIFSHLTTDGPPPRVPSLRGVRRSRGVCIQKHIPKVLISGILIRAGSASGIHTPPLPWHPFRKGTLPPCHLYPLSPPNSCLSSFSMFHNPISAYIPPRDDRRTATASPLFRGVRRSRGVCIRKQIPKVIIGHFYKSPRRGVTFINTVQAMNGVATEWEQHRSWCSAVTIIGNQ